MDSYEWLFSGSLTIVLEPLDEPIWTTASGEEIPLSKMTTRHIVNCINHLKTCKSKYNDRWIAIFKAEYKRRLSLPLEQTFTL